MGESKKRNEMTSEEVIAAFDRERDHARELSRRYAEQFRQSRAHDRPVYIDRRRRPR